MAVYVRDGETSRHLDLRCAAADAPVHYMENRRWRTDAGDTVRYVRNRGASVGPACPRCLVPGDALPSPVPLPLELSEALDTLAAHAGTPKVVYDLRHPATRKAQVGSGASDRLAKRWRATIGGRLRRDSVWWLYDLAATGRLDELTVSVETFEDGASALARERSLREELRRDGWQVSSTV